MGFLDDIKNAWNGRMGTVPKMQEPPPPPEKFAEGSSRPSPLPTNRVSKPDSSDFDYSQLSTYYKQLGILKPAWYLKLIPYLRRLAETNEDVGQALYNIVTLGNTGHKVFFHDSVDADEVERMRDHLREKGKQWAKGLAGMDGLVNRWMAQIMVGGALSNEWVPNQNLTGVESCILVKPEDVRFKLNDRKTEYLPYQQLKYSPYASDPLNTLIPLNPETFKYYAYQGDGENPYGIPVYLTVLRGVKSQNDLRDNIDYVCAQLGVMGFTSLEIEKPEIEDLESEEQYYARLEARLDQASARIKEGTKEGTIVSYKDADKATFTSISRDFDGVTKIVEQNELWTSSGLKMDASLMGRGYSTSEGQITIIFTKLMSEFQSVQAPCKANLEFGYELELTLAGFQHAKGLSVEFNRSTLQDELKYQQGQEIKIRNLHSLRIDGIISPQQHADELGYDKPYSEDPIVPFEQQDGKPEPSDPEAAQKREKGKDASDRKGRDKNRPQGTKNPK